MEITCCGVVRRPSLPRVGIQWIDYSASPLRHVRVNFELNILVPVSLGFCAFARQQSGGGAGWAGAVQLGGLVHEAHSISWDHI